MAAHTSIPSRVNEHDAGVFEASARFKEGLNDHAPLDSLDLNESVSDVLKEPQEFLGRRTITKRQAARIVSVVAAEWLGPPRQRFALSDLRLGGRWN